MLRWLQAVSCRMKFRIKAGYPLWKNRKPRPRTRLAIHADHGALVGVKPYYEEKLDEHAKSVKKCAIVGGGPAGLMAASVLADHGFAVSVYDGQATMGRKFLLAGLGGLNLTNALPLEEFSQRYGRQSERFESMIRQFSPDDLRAWAARLGVETFEGSGRRVFPRDMKASGLLRAWLRDLAEKNVTFFPRHDWRGFSGNGSLSFVGKEEGETHFVSADAVLLALGGSSWPRVGTDGRWTPILEKQEISVAPLRPSNCGFEIEWSALFQEKFSGAPLKTIVLSFQGHTATGDMTFSRYGVEGGCVYALSGPLRDEIEKKGHAILAIDLKRDMTEHDVRQRLTSAVTRDSLSNRLRKALGLSPVAISLLYEVAAAPDLKNPEKLARLIKAAPLKLLRPRPIAEAISSAGGVRFEELDERLMLKKRPGVFVAGEMLDWEAPTGGFLLQGCISSGVWAARGMIAFLEKNQGIPES